MKRIAIQIMTGIALIATQAFAGNGDLIVDGKLGVGTTTPTTKLDVIGDVNVTGIRLGNPRLGIIGYSGGDYSSVGYGYVPTGTSGSYNYGISDTASQIRFTSGGFEFRSAGAGTTGNPITWTTPMIIASNGNVGIGNASSGSLLHVFGTGLASINGTRRGLVSLSTPFDNNSYTSLDVIYSGNSNPVARIASRLLANGSYWMIGTSNSYASGVTNTALTIDPIGSVGIGTTSPGYRLDVVGDVNVSGTRLGNPRLGVMGYSGGDYASVGYGYVPTGITGNYNYGISDTASQIRFTSGGFEFKSAAAGTIGNPITWTTPMIIASNGNVGIGTTTPTSPLEVVGNSHWANGWRHGIKITSNDFPTLRLHSLGTGKTSFIGNDNDGSLWFGINGSDSASGAYGMVIQPSGNVGVATWYPSTTLHVNGSFSVTNGTKNFDIKDPRYSDNRHRLIHSSLEGPEAGVYYRGEAKLENGRATVTLPPYFEALTRKANRTVLLTPEFEQEGELICNVAASSVKNGEFIIRSFGVPDPSVCMNKVYWEVKAERSDVGKLSVEEIREDYPEKEKVREQR